VASGDEARASGLAEAGDASWRPRAGVVIAVVGLGGAGKSSGVKAASERLAADGISVTTFHSRAEFLGLTQDVLGDAGEPLTVDEKLLLMAFERVRELRHELEPARQGFDVVLADRYWHCFLVRALADGGSQRTLRILAALGSLPRRPDAILWLDVQAGIAVDRIARRGAWRANEEYGERLRSGYAQLADRYGFERIDASASPASVRDAIVGRAHAVLARRLASAAAPVHTVEADDRTR
jgi:thymidylate kinase